MRYQAFSGVLTAPCMRGAVVFELLDYLLAIFPSPLLVQWLTQLLIVVYGSY